MLSTLPLSFVTVVETGSITLASEKLNIAKSAVSQNLKRLEQALGVKLATRTTRRFTLTPAGERYYQSCKEILSLAKRAANEMEDFGAEPAGSITLTAPHAMIGPVIVPAMRGVIKMYPKLRPSIIADDQRLDLVAAGIDVSIRVGDLENSSLRAKRVGTLRDIICALPTLLDGLNTENTKEYISQVQALPYITHSREGSFKKRTFKKEEPKEYILHKKGSITPLCVTFEPTLFTNTIESTLAFAKAGLGIALLPDLIINNTENNNLVELFPDFLLPEKNIYAVHAYGNMPPQSVITIINAVKAEFDKNHKKLSEKELSEHTF